MEKRNARALLKKRLHQSGFTLIEVITVVLIIGIIVSFAVLSIADRAQDDRLENEARRLVELIRLGSDEAVLLGIELGLSSDGEKYEFVTIGEEGNWVRYQENGPLRPRKLPDGMKLEITSEDFLPPKDKKEDKEVLIPNLLFLSSGELTPFQLVIDAAGATTAFLIEGELTGKVSIRNLSAQEFASDFRGRL